MLAFAGDLRRKGLVRLSVEHVGYHAYNLVVFMLFLSLIDIETDISSVPSSTSTIHHPPSTILAYLDTNAHVVETVWVARMGVGSIYIYIQLIPLAGVETDC